MSRLHLLEAHAIADAAGERYEAARALNNLGYTHDVLGAARSGDAVRAAGDWPTPTEHEVHNLSSYSAVVIAWLRLRAGEWDEAERVTQGEIDKGITVTQLLAKTVLAELAVRRGDADAADRLADVAAQADRTDELQRITPVLELATEYALTRDSPMPIATFDKIARRVRPTRSASPDGVRFELAPGRRSPGSTCPIDDDTSSSHTLRWCGATGGRPPTRSATWAGCTTGR